MDVSTKLERLRKKAIKRFFKPRKASRLKDIRFLQWRKRLVLIHPCADEIELLKKIDWEPESCLDVDGYYFQKDQVCFFQICAPKMWYKGITSSQVSYSFTWENYRSVKWKLHRFAIFTDCSPITLDVVGESIKIIDNWFEQHPTS